MPYFFRLPIITDLTIDQQSALNEPGAIAISGSPGTGKSVVSLWRHIQNHDMPRRLSLLLTYTKSLEKYLASSAFSENEGAGNHVNRTYWWTTHHANKDYEEIIIDEAQDVEETRYIQIQQLTPMVSYSADNNQIIFPAKSTREERLRQIFNGNAPYTLQENYRNTIEIVQFVRSMYPVRLINAGREHGPKPSVILSGGDMDTQFSIVKDVIEEFQGETHNIAILVPLAHSTVHQNQTVNFWYNQLVNDGISCSKFTGDDGEIGLIENVHITTFKSAKGLEFDTVIIPNFDRYRSNIENLNVVEENDYYVVLTRARRNLMLIDNSTTSQTNCSLNFLQSQIRQGIVEVDNHYSNVQNPPTPNIFADDLPF